MKNFDDKKFREKLLRSQLDEILTCTDVNIAAEMLVSKLTDILDEMAHIKTVQTRTNYAPWIADETKELQKDRNEAQEKQLSPMTRKTGDSTQV